ncbi:MAG: hemerythrin family protein [Sterolibacterium sp.]|jgi:hemerythrin
METAAAPALWDSSFKLDDPVVDFEHQMIFSLIENCVRVSRNGGTKDQLIEILSITKSYLAYHFASEESMMAGTGDGRFDNHRAQHAHLLAALTDEIAGLRDDVPSVTAQNIAFTLSDWYAVHLQREDTQLIN